MKRVLAAGSLAVAVLAIPTAAWYVVGQRDARNEASRMESAVVADAKEVGVRLSAVVTSRLEGVRETENRRPYFHYQNLFHDPRGAYVGASVQLSPLAEGNFDPLVAGYFQIDSKGRVSMPTLNDDVPELNYWSIDRQRELLSHLDASSTEIVTAARERDMALAVLIRRPGNKINSSFQASKRTPTPTATAAPTPTIVAANSAGNTGNTDNNDRVSQVQRLEPQQWTYNQSANQVYSEIKSRSNLPVAQQQAEVLGNVNPKKTPVAVATPRPRVVRQARRGPDIVIEVGTLNWHTVSLDDQPQLLALRLIRTPAGELTQGFLVSPPAVNDLLGSSAFPAALLPGVPGDSLDAPLAIEGSEWIVKVAANEALAQARVQAQAVQNQFRGTFFFGSGIALIAAFMLVTLVWKSEELAQQRSRFAASAAHELRTPLAGIRMYGEMLAEGLGDPARAQDYARRVASEADRLARIVKNVLGFTRLEQGNLNVSPSEGDLASAVRASIEQQRPSLERAGIELVSEIPASPIMAVFDRDAVAQVLQNLLDNAEKYTRDADSRRVVVSLDSSDGFALLSVRDFGPGLPSRLRRRAFRPFSRGDSADAPAGLGLGLSLAKGLAEAMSGRLGYGDPDDGGAAFTCSVPLA